MSASVGDGRIRAASTSGREGDGRAAIGPRRRCAEIDVTPRREWSAQTKNDERASIAVPDAGVAEPLGGRGGGGDPPPRCANTGGHPQRSHSL